MARRLSRKKPPMRTPDRRVKPTSTTDSPSTGIGGDGQVFAHPTCDYECTAFETCHCWHGYYWVDGNWSYHQGHQCECIALTPPT